MFWCAMEGGADQTADKNTIYLWVIGVTIGQTAVVLPPMSSTLVSVRTIDTPGIISEIESPLPFFAGAWSFVRAHSNREFGAQRCRQR